MDERIISGGESGIEKLFGNFDENIKIIEREFGVNIVYRDNAVKVSGHRAGEAEVLISRLLNFADGGGEINEQSIRYLSDILKEDSASDISSLNSDCICTTVKGAPIKAKTLGQKEYTNTIKNNIITIGVGPAGTGKTYLAVAMAVAAFKRKEVNRIILTRPAVEAGESLGFLPGDLQDKVDPYLRPLYDALFEMLGGDNYNSYHEKGMIEVAPLAYMRGRTLDNSYIILDEAQNTTREQMKMFLTRIGFNSKVVITGDVTQIDLPRGKLSGLKDAIRVLSGIEDIGICYLSARDVVRHPLIQKIIKAYAKNGD